MDKEPISVGSRVKILNCQYSDVTGGMSGVVVGLKDDGYAVEVIGRFLVAGATPKYEQRKETVWLENDQLELCETQ